VEVRIVQYYRKKTAASICHNGRMSYAKDSLDMEAEEKHRKT
jgi:hypothetical protein